jgi:hypothetical protein
MRSMESYLFDLRFLFHFSSPSLDAYYFTVKYRQISLYTEYPNTKWGVKSIVVISIVAIPQYNISAFI